MKRKILFVLSFLVAVMFINAGLDKFLHYMPMPKEMPEKMVKAGTAFVTIGWLMPLIGTMEIVGGVLLIFRKTAALGAIMLVPIVIGIFLSNLFVSPHTLPLAIVLMAVIGWVIADNWEKYLPMLSA